MILQLGKQKRIDRIMGKNGKTFIVPVDDLLISGADNQLLQYKEKIALLAETPINAVLGYPGVFRQFYDELQTKAWILNLTTSTIRSDHTSKRLSFSLEDAVSFGCDAVAVHVNLTSNNEGEMIQNLCWASSECNKYGIPLLAIVYVRSVDSNGKDENYLALKQENNREYTRLVAHACCVAAQCGADIIKTNYTGSADGFSRVIYAAGNIPVVIAGGEEVSETEAIENIRGALDAGSAGVCFGRNFFYRKDILAFSTKVSEMINAEK